MASPAIRKRFLVLACGALIISGAGFFASRQPTGVFPKAVHIGERAYALEIADTGIERTMGLGGRDALCEACGMLFVFDRPGRHAFWMQGMRFPIDIVWLLGDQVVFVARAVSPDLAGTIDPAVSADRVIELPSGAAQAVDAGETLRFSY